VQTEVQTELGNLRLQRKVALCASFLIVSIAIVVCLPRAINRRERLKAANDELIRLQAEIVASQKKLGEVQFEILNTQKQIRSIIGEHR
jgi:uncharacterized protein YlxW (UPF0749 family)